MSYQFTIILNLLISLGSIVSIYAYIKNVNFFNEYLFFLYNIIKENNPLLPDKSDYYNVNLLLDSEDKVEIIKKPIQLYENKYLEKFKQIVNEFKFNSDELELEQQEFDRLKLVTKNNYLLKKSEILEKLSKIKEINDKGFIDNSSNFKNDNFNEFGKTELILYFDLDYDEEDEINYEEIYLDVLIEKVKLEEELIKLDESLVSEDELKVKANEFIIKIKLDSFINNYVLEHTPLGNVYMRYNNDKKTFEYFSNNTIPYRYLEPIGRKYVITYNCKPIFIDIEEELKRAEEKMEEDLKKNINKPIKIEKFKNYNKDVRLPSKNRSSSEFAIPAHMRANVLNVKSDNEKKILKENANRYTWEGRLNSFSPLKKIDKKIVNKNLNLTFAEFKKSYINKK
uniref:Uncharacterized protein n=1 Tax=viral metagenome TaxID=1070528 RepID=A0A6C0KMR2_9ZZZZ